MFGLLRKIQRRPEQERRTIALWIALGITALIFVLWIVSFFAHLDQLSSPADARIAEEVSPINSSQETFLSAWRSLKGSLTDLF